MRDLAVPAMFAGDVLLTALTGCSSRPDPASPRTQAMATMDPAANQVVMTDFKFSPESMSIMAGDSVVWVNKGKAPHTSTSGRDGRPDGKWDSGNINPGGTYVRTFSTPGVYWYYCTPHVTMGMQGRILVQAR